MPKQPCYAPPAPEAWAEVRSHDHVMRYRRSGAGRALLLLRPADAPDALWPELADALGGRFRVIVPDAPPADSDVSAWLLDFLEGLGSVDVAVIAAEPYCVPALELALLDAEQVARVLLVPGGAPMHTALDGALATGARTACVSLQMLRRGVPAAEAIPVVMRFLEGCAEHRPG